MLVPVSGPNERALLPLGRSFIGLAEHCAANLTVQEIPNPEKQAEDLSRIQTSLPEAVNDDTVFSESKDAEISTSSQEEAPEAPEASEAPEVALQVTSPNPVCVSLLDKVKIAIVIGLIWFLSKRVLWATDGLFWSKKESQRERQKQRAVMSLEQAGKLVNAMLADNNDENRDRICLGKEARDLIRSVQRPDDHDLLQQAQCLLSSAENDLEHLDIARARGRLLQAYNLIEAAKYRLVSQISSDSESS